MGNEKTKSKSMLTRLFFNLSLFLFIFLPSSYALFNIGDEIGISGYTYNDYEYTGFTAGSSDPVYLGDNILKFEYNGRLVFLDLDETPHKIFEYNPSTGSGTKYNITGTMSASCRLLDYDYKYGTIIMDCSTGGTPPYNNIVTYDYFLMKNYNVSFSYLATSPNIVNTGSAGNEMVRVNANDDFFFISNRNNNTIYKMDDSDLTIIDTQTFSNGVVDMLTDTSFIYVLLTDGNLYKYDTDFNLEEQTTLNMAFYIPYAYYYFEDGLISYNPLTDSIYFFTNQTHMDVYDTSLNLISSADYSYNLMDAIPSFVMKKHEYSANLFSLQKDDIYVCDYDGNCLNIDRDMINNGNDTYMNIGTGGDLFFNGKNPNSAGFFYSNSAYILTKSTSTGTKINLLRLSGFITTDVFADAYTIVNVNVSPTTQNVGFPVDINVLATHSMGSTFLRYAYDCDSSEYDIDVQNYNDATSFNTSYYESFCNADSIANYFGLPFYAMDLSTCGEGYDYRTSSALPKAFTYKALLTIIDGDNITVSLSHNDTYDALKLKYSYDSSAESLSIYQWNGSDYDYILSKKLYINDLYVLPYTDRNIINIYIMIDLKTGTYRLNNYVYGEPEGAFSKAYSINQNVSKIIGYRINGTDGQFYSNIIDSTTFPTFTTSSSYECTYATPGTYYTKTYVSTRSQVDYDDYRIVPVYITEYTLSEQMETFNDQFDSMVTGSKSAMWWRMILFFAFTLGIAYGVGFMRDSSKEFTTMYIEFLIGMTFMTFVMCKIFYFFPMYLFISVLIVDALTLAKYLMGATQ